ncbi:hypothetical protein E1A91_D08G056000v1 [Gossypium mustelinum]|uniref:Major facilitator superfamily (MFS) profile domain-containing protein n=1 Tax=Gossypium mustelinum TaxID=34275 RepID=A0A5D2TUX4_GOSMU|nr:hypothetical protein E1A91_D08G056000v1 [Gossypium mustelinum]
MGLENGESSMKEPLLLHHAKKTRSLKVVFLTTFVAVLGSYEFGSCMGYSAPVQSAITKELHLSIAEFSVFGSILNVGAIIGAITSGRIADFMGRKGAMRISSGFSITGWIAIYFSKGALLLDIGRLPCGYGIGIFAYVVPIYVGEIAPKDVRGGLAALNQLMIVIGASTTFVVGTALEWRISSNWYDNIEENQRLLGLNFICESPRWLAKVGYEKEFYTALKRLHGDDEDAVSHEANEIQDYLETLEHQSNATMLDLFQTRYMHSIIIGVGLMMFQQFGGINGVAFYANQIFTSAGFSSSKIAIIAFASIQIPITAVSAFLVDNCGRKPLLLASSTGAFLGCFIAAISFLMKEHNLLQQWVPLLVLSGLLIFVGSFAIGMGAVPWVLLSEIFPINVKGAAGSLVNLEPWFGAWAVSYTFNFLMDWSPSGEGSKSSRGKVGRSKSFEGKEFVQLLLFLSTKLCQKLKEEPWKKYKLPSILQVHNFYHFQIKLFN